MGRREGLGPGVWGGAEKRESWGQTGSAAMWGGGDEDGGGVPLPTSHPSPTHSSNYVRIVCVCVCVCVCARGQVWEPKDGGSGLRLVWGPGLV